VGLLAQAARSRARLAIKRIGRADITVLLERDGVGTTPESRSNYMIQNKIQILDGSIQNHLALGLFGHGAILWLRFGRA
jgi:hypothetical protein